MHEDKIDFDISVGNRFINKAGETVEIMGNVAEYLLFEVIKTDFSPRIGAR